MVGRTGFEPATFCTSSTSSSINDFYDFQFVDLQRAEATAKDKVYYSNKFFNKVKIDPEAVRVGHIRHYLKAQNCSCYVYKNLRGALKVFFRDFFNRPEVVKFFKFPRPSFKPKIVPTREETQRFFDAVDTKVGRDLFLFYALSGLRKNEVLGLTKDCIDFEKRMIVPSGNSGVAKNSYVSFYNGEIEHVLKKIELGKDRLFIVSN